MAWIIALMCVIVFIEVPTLWHKKMFKELLSFALLWAIAFVYASLVALKVPLPTVVSVLKYIYGWAK